MADLAERANEHKVFAAWATFRVSKQLLHTLINGSLKEHSAQTETEGTHELSAQSLSSLYANARIEKHIKLATRTACSPSSLVHPVEAS